MRTPNSLWIVILFFLPLMTVAQHKHHEKKVGQAANEYMHKRPVADLIKNFESPERAAWQKPEEVIEFIGPVEGKKVLDIGAGSGYFSFRLAEAGAKVIAADVNDEFQEYIEKRKQALHLTDKELELRKIPYDSPGIEPGEVDMALIVNTYHHMDDRAVYFRKLKEDLKEGGSLVVVDYVDKDTPVGPPRDHRLGKGYALSELSDAGFTEFTVNLELLPYQYIIIAK